MEETLEAQLKKHMEQMSNETINSFEDLLHSRIKKAGQSVKRFQKNLARKKTDQEKLIFITGKLNELDLFQITYNEDQKNDETAKVLKEEGNQCFAKGKYCRALRAYTILIMTAQDEELLAEAYANRSATLFKLKLYTECLVDIERAIAHNYPEKLQSRLIDRRVKATELLRVSLRLQPPHEEIPTIPPKERNFKHPCAINKVEVRKYKTGKKKSVFAIKPIAIGDVICVEEPLVKVIRNMHPHHCHECINLCYNPIPCEVCTQAVYCSEVCKKSAFDTYHKFECPILLSLRRFVGRRGTLCMATNLFFQYGAQLPAGALHLMERVKSETFHEEEKLQITGAVLYELIKKYTDKFKGEDGEALEQFFKNNIVQLLRVCMFNATGVIELCPHEDDSKAIIGHDTMAVAIYTFYSNFRHSCGPNTFESHYGKMRVLRALRTIKKGDEIFVSYGPNYLQDDIKMRKDIIQRQYHFTCNCSACRANWLPMDMFPDFSPHSEDTNIMNRLKNKPDVEYAKKIILEKIKKVRTLEKKEPDIALAIQQKILLHCFDILASKRMIT